MHMRLLPLASTLQLLGAAGFRLTPSRMTMRYDMNIIFTTQHQQHDHDAALCTNVNGKVAQSVNAI
jgi:hypothetical protein